MPALTRKWPNLGGGSREAISRVESRTSTTGVDSTVYIEGGEPGDGSEVGLLRLGGEPSEHPIIDPLLAKRRHVDLPGRGGHGQAARDSAHRRSLWTGRTRASRWGARHRTGFTQRQNAGVSLTSPAAERLRSTFEVTRPVGNWGPHPPMAPALGLESEESLEACRDDIDNDGDGHVDEVDFDCGPVLGL